jgi:hypothetical protein
MVRACVCRRVCVCVCVWVWVWVWVWSVSVFFSGSTSAFLCLVICLVLCYTSSLRPHTLVALLVRLCLFMCIYSFYLGVQAVCSTFHRNLNVRISCPRLFFWGGPGSVLFSGLSARRLEASQGVVQKKGQELKNMQARALHCQAEIRGAITSDRISYKF